MSAPAVARVPAGVPTGGQFAASARAESEISLRSGIPAVAAPAGRNAPRTVTDIDEQPVLIRPGVIDGNADYAYRNGQCLALALAVSEHTGWPVHLVLTSPGDVDPDDPDYEYALQGASHFPALRHAYVVTPDGTLLDVRGENDADIVDEEARDLDGDLYLLPRTVPADQAAALLDEFGDALVDQDLDAAATLVGPVMSLRQPPVQEMPATEFAERFAPGLWSGTWADLDALADQDVPMPQTEEEFEETGGHFAHGGERGWTVDDLATSLSEEPMRDPVEVIDGEVRDGHHRIVAALRVGAPIRYQEW